MVKMISLMLCVFHHNFKKYKCFKEDGTWRGALPALWEKLQGLQVVQRCSRAWEGSTALLWGYSAPLPTLRRPSAWTQTLMVNSPIFPTKQGHSASDRCVPSGHTGCLSGEEEAPLGPGEQAPSSHPLHPPGQKQLPGQEGLRERKGRVKTRPSLSPDPRIPSTT